MRNPFPRIWRITQAAAHVVGGVAPFVPGPAGLVLNTVKAAVQLAEGLGPGKGVIKKQLATDIAVHSLKVIESASGRDLFDEQKLAADLGPLIESVVEYYKLQKGN